VTTTDVGHHVGCGGLVEHRHWPATYLDPPEDQLQCRECGSDLDWDEVSDDYEPPDEDVDPDPLEEARTW